MRTIVMRDSELIYAISGLEASFRDLDQYRVKWAGKGVNDVTEEAMRQRLGAMTQMIAALNGEYHGVEDDFRTLTYDLRQSHEKTPWETKLPRELEQAQI